jgi:hypothetical protein
LREASASEPVDEVSKADQVMSKPRVDPTFGISSADVLKLTERHPAWA